MDKIIERLRQEGMRITAQRKAVLQFLNERSSSISIKNLYAELNKRRVKIDEASVYRMVETLKELKLVHTHNDGRITLCSHHSCGHNFHYSIECTSCRSVEEPNFKPKDEKALAKLLGLDFKKINHVQIKALCSDCA